MYKRERRWYYAVGLSTYSISAFLHQEPRLKHDAFYQGHTLSHTHLISHPHISISLDSIAHSKVHSKNRSLLQPLRASLVMLSCVWRGRFDIVNWLFTAHFLKVSMELKATDWLPPSPTDKMFVTSANPEELHLFYWWNHINMHFQLSWLFVVSAFFASCVLNWQSGTIKTDTFWCFSGFWCLQHFRPLAPINLQTRWSQGFNEMNSIIVKLII